MKINFEEIIRNLEHNANRLYKDNTRLKELLVVARSKAEGNKHLMEIWSDLKLFIELIKDWMKGDYVNLPKETVIMIIVSLIYLVSPIDLIPDFLIGGFIDDALVIGYVIKKTSEELETYKEWKSEQEDILEEEDIFEKEDIFQDEDIFERDYKSKEILDEDIFEK